MQRSIPGKMLGGPREVVETRCDWSADYKEAVEARCERSADGKEAVETRREWSTDGKAASKRDVNGMRT